MTTLACEGKKDAEPNVDRSSQSRLLDLVFGSRPQDALTREDVFPAGNLYLPHCLEMTGLKRYFCINIK
jgi:hypothetical protein